MDNKLVSVIVPVYNSEDRIIECINSIINQTYDYMEVIIINDGSTDNTINKLKTFRNNKNVRIFTSENRGVSEARNRGIKEANGEFLTFVDADDLIDKDYIEYLMGLYDKYHTSIVSCQHRVKFKNNKIIDYELNGKKSSVWSAHDWCSDILKRENLDLSTVCKLYKKDLFNEISFPNGKLFEDTATTYRLVIASSHIGVGSKSKYSYILRSNSITRSKFNEDYMQLIEQTKIMVQRITNKYPDLKRQGELRQSWARVSVMNSIITSGLVYKYKKYLMELKFSILSNKGVILSDLNPDLRLKLVVIFLSFGIKPYISSVKIMSKVRKHKFIK